MKIEDKQFGEMQKRIAKITEFYNQIFDDALIEHYRNLVSFGQVRTAVYLRKKWNPLYWIRGPLKIKIL